MSKSPLRNKTVRSGKKSSSFQEFSKFATIIGFVNDLIGLITFIVSIASFVLVLLSDRRNSDGIVLPLVHITVTPMYPLILWIIALYGYFSYLRVYWINNLEEKTPNSNFAGFVFDLLFFFRDPLRLSPFFYFVDVINLDFSWS
ncbi:MAG: hypothetical protein GFH27_549289n126 [Chloroflexi bacterium AL-W]|nr:hypothetical protein [Chloroflexi bacterium AL-N1]NOK66858.1 hypothetical protein [Chloroflexi bacterium AL-N10]NOK74850.1 hypothetical protein [Chloroflexi bacterium AL-N5]NOK81461.1 hypothetical protein [Chloroflexi bacterium AL-W]NOK88930.1 hypothetical protein [Chloroflexi bacterium AL-N15]